MTATARVALDASTLVRGWYLDVNTGTVGSPTWTPVSGIMEFKPSTNAVLKDDTSFDDGGNGSSLKTAAQWKIELKLKRAPQAAALTAYDAGAEALRAASLLFGTSNRKQIRWYEVNSGGPVTEAWQGTAAVEWDEDANGQDDPRAVSVTLTGCGARTTVSPNPGSA